MVAQELVIDMVKRYAPPLEDGGEGQEDAAKDGGEEEAAGGEEKPAQMNGNGVSSA